MLLIFSGLQSTTLLIVISNFVLTTRNANYSEVPIFTQFGEKTQGGNDSNLFANVFKYIQANPNFPLYDSSSPT